MTIQEAIKSEKKVRRKNWVNPEFKEFDLWNDLDSLDILANDWEVEEEIPTELEVGPAREPFSMWSLEDDYLTAAFLIGDHGYEATEEDVDKILTFLYNNTKIGKSRIIPF